MSIARELVRGTLLSAVDSQSPGSRYGLSFEADGAMVLDGQGKILAVGSFDQFKDLYAQLPLKDYSGSVLVPSFVDTHIHFPQLNMIGSCAEGLLDWLDRYTFPQEAAFRGRTPFVAEAARNFVDELVSHGTSGAVVFSSSCGDATGLLFEEFERRGLRGIIGKTSMDRHCPDAIKVSLDDDKRWTEELSKTWHGHDKRLFYALTPRFAPSCSDPLMDLQKDFLAQDPSLYLQTHYAENKGELAWVAQLYPQSHSYLDVYDRQGILGERTILAHSVHTDARDEALLLERGVVISHCPSSNLFLGSGLFKTRQYLDQGQKLTLGTDIGAGTSFSQWQTMNEGYKVAQLRGERVTVAELLALATLAPARHLKWDSGSFEVGREADFQVINPQAKGILARHWAAAQTPDEHLAALIHFADDRSLTELRVRGRTIFRSGF